MQILPFLTDEQDALEYWQDNQPAHPAVAAYVAGYLAKHKVSNKESRRLMGIEKVYTMTHYRRIGTRLSSHCLEIWLNNPERIGTGHVRAISSLPPDQHEESLRDLLTKKTIVRDLEAVAAGKEVPVDADIDSLQRKMSEAIGFPVTVRWRKESRTGTLSLKFFSLNDLDDLGKRLGYESDETY